VQIWGQDDEGFDMPRSLSFARFVSGGAELIDNNKFFHCGEYLGLLGNRLLFLGVEYKATCTRIAADWGWLITFDNMSPSLVMRSLDHSSPCPSAEKSEDELLGLDLDQCEGLRSPLALLPRYALYPRHVGYLY
jgi:hypothetical protein